MSQILATTEPDLFSAAGMVVAGFTTTAPNVKCETKKDAIERAKRLQFLQMRIAETPSTLEALHGNMGDIEFFIKRSLQGTFDCHCHDGLQRLPHSFEEMCDVPGHEYDAWVRNEAPYRNKLHPATITVLNQSKELCRSMIANGKARLPEMEAEVHRLKAVGPLPEDVANKCRLTIDGELAALSMVVSETASATDPNGTTEANDRPGQFQGSLFQQALPLSCPLCTSPLGEDAEIHVLSCALAEMSRGGPKIELAKRVEEAARKHHAAVRL